MCVCNVIETKTWQGFRSLALQTDQKMIRIVQVSVKRKLLRIKWCGIQSRVIYYDGTPVKKDGYHEKEEERYEVSGLYPPM